MADALEKRFLGEVRRSTAEGRRLVGMAARYGPIADLGSFQERIAPGAFSGSLGAQRDILALFDHDPTKVLGRTQTKTLILEDRSDGLAFNIALPETTAGRDALALAERGDLGGASIGFIVTSESLDGETRVIERAKLFEISVVSAWPAYVETSVEARRELPRCAAPGVSILTPETMSLNQLKKYLETI